MALAQDSLTLFGARLRLSILQALVEHNPVDYVKDRHFLISLHRLLRALIFSRDENRLFEEILNRDSVSLGDLVEGRRVRLAQAALEVAQGFLGHPGDLSRLTKSEPSLYAG